MLRRDEAVLHGVGKETGDPRGGDGSDGRQAAQVEGEEPRPPSHRRSAAAPGTISLEGMARNLFET